MLLFVIYVHVITRITRAGEYDPEQIHLSFGSSFDDIFVTWASTGTNKYPSTQSFVTFGTSSNVYSLNASSSKVYTYKSGGWDGLLYWSHLTSLKQNTKYYYQIISESTNSAQYSFTFNHPLTLTDSFSFLMVGDLGQKTESSSCVKTNGCSNATISALNNLKFDEYSFLIHVGDIAYSKGDESIWDNYFNEIQTITTHLPYMVCPGNHESYYNFTAYKSRFNMINWTDTHNLYYSWIYGGVYFLSYSTEHNFSRGSVQYEWIMNDLKVKNIKNDPNIKWKILYSHRPIYCSTSDEYDCHENGPGHIEPIFEPLLSEYKFDLYFAGHLHNYERTYSVYNFSHITKNEEKGLYLNPAHTVNVVIGMSGDIEGLTDSWYPQPDWSAFRKAELGYAKLNVYNDTNLDFQFISSDDGKIIDQFTIQKQPN